MLFYYYQMDIGEFAILISFQNFFFSFRIPLCLIYTIECLTVPRTLKFSYFPNYVMIYDFHCGLGSLVSLNPYVRFLLKLFSHNVIIPFSIHLVIQVFRKYIALISLQEIFAYVFIVKTILNN